LTLVDRSTGDVLADQAIDRPAKWRSVSFDLAEGWLEWRAGDRALRVVLDSR
jgi:hypothetical protein